MLQEIRLDALRASATNPRKTFDEVKLQELARSVATVGVLEPILVRRWQSANPNLRSSLGERFEIVAGERRYRAAVIARTTANGHGAHLDTVPCIVLELTDIQVLEIQTIENLQRDDVHPLEEAAGYAALMKEAGYDVDEIAQKISKSEKYVYDRIKLLQLIPRRARIDQWVPAETAISRALATVEDMGADVRLTRAVILLGDAKDRVADYVDGVPDREPFSLGPVLAAIDAEAELPGPMPDEFYLAMQMGREACEEACRSIVRVTKRNIRERVAAIATARAEPTRG